MKGKKILLYDLLCAQPNGASKFHGGGECAKTILRESILYLGKNASERLAVCFNPQEYMDKWIFDLLEKYKIPIIEVSNHDDIYELLNRGCFNRFYSAIPYWMKQEKLTKEVETYGTIHGLRSIELPADKASWRYSRGVWGRAKETVRFFLQSRFRKRNVKHYGNCLRSLNRVYTDSWHSAYALKKWFSYGDARVIYPPPKYIEATAVGFVQPRISGKYILLICADRWEKNAWRGIQACDDLISRGGLSGYSIVVVGLSSVSYLKGMRNLDKIIALDYLDAHELECLYKGCDIFFYPTLNEGFGYPPLEAMKYGKTCVVSNVCSLPEICGDVVYYTSPYDIDEMEVRLLEASGRSIDPQRILDHYKTIEKRQLSDLRCMIVDLFDGDSPTPDNGTVIQKSTSR